MTRHRSLRLLGLALVSALAWSLAPGDAAADRGDRDDGREYRERGYDHDRDRDDRNRDDRWDRDNRWDRRDRDDRRDRSDWRGSERRGDHDRYDRYDRRPDWDRRFVRHDLRRVRVPFYCSAHRNGFRSQGHFHDHLSHYHGVPSWYVPRLVAQIGLGWTFGH